MILLYPYTIIGSHPQTERPRPESWSGHKCLGNYRGVGSGIYCFSLLLMVFLWLVHHTEDFSLDCRDHRASWDLTVFLVYTIPGEWLGNEKVDG